jgi:hypothetical protein
MSKSNEPLTINGIEMPAYLESDGNGGIRTKDGVTKVVEQKWSSRIGKWIPLRILETRMPDGTLIQ